jgi:carbon monoxide dehydrogenase subunit G
MRIAASRTLPAEPADVFAFLRQPQNHRRLATGSIHLLELSETTDGELGGALMLISGPLGRRRLARTRLESLSEPSHLAGTARVDSGSEVTVRWDLIPAVTPGTVAVLSASLTRIGVRDRILLLAGGRRWLGRVFAATLEQLAVELAPPGNAAEGSGCRGHAERPHARPSRVRGSAAGGAAAGAARAAAGAARI